MLWLWSQDIVYQDTVELWDDIIVVWNSSSFIYKKM